MKVCIKCNNLKIYKFFNKDSSRKDGYNNKCKSCCKQYRNDNKNKIKAYREEYKKQNKNSVFYIKVKKCKKCQIEKDIYEFQKQINFKDGYDSCCKKCRYNIKIYSTITCSICKIVYNTETYSASKEKSKQCNHCKKEQQNKYRKKYFKNNKAKCAIRNIIYQSFIRALKGEYIKSVKTEYLLGCTMEYAMSHIESTFKEGMTWKNHGRCSNGDCNNVWHIDHIIPLYSAITEEELIKLCHYTNLQALWAGENLSKGKNIIDEN